MFSSRLASFVILGTFVGSAAAVFEIISPGGESLWWVAESANTIVWTCRDDAPATAYTLLLNNSNPAILPTFEAIVANIANADCSHTITTQQAALTPAQGYTLMLADSLDETKIYATSKSFEVKALGASYPPASATPTDNPSASTSGSGSGTASGSGASATSTKSSNGAFATFEISAAGMLAAVGAVIGML
ncbi:hypothetical protein BGW80DRAFT_1305348 [Lactifluus volemus]|nr:hypothetical protein BGW80DRAFT_1305348 [Lactifluus volemus]